MQIKKTKNYKMFKFSKYTASRIDELEANRILKLAVAIEHKNLLHINPITVDKKMVILDGQTRLKAAELLDVPIYYVEVAEGINPMDIAFMNDNVKKWSARNYCEFWIAHGNKEYEIIKWFHQKYDISYDMSIVLLGGKLDENQIKNTTAIRKAFKTGEFKASNLEQAKLIAEQIDDFSEYINWNKAKYFIRAFRNLASKDDYSHETMMKQVENNPRKLQKCATARDCLLMLTELYNYHLSNKNRLKIIQGDANT